MDVMLPKGDNFEILTGSSGNKFFTICPTLGVIK